MKAQDFYSWCIEHERDNLLAEWNYERNLPIVPDKIARGSDKKVWWKCKEGHEWQAPLVIGESLIDHVQYAKELIHWLKE